MASKKQNILSIGEICEQLRNFTLLHPEFEHAYTLALKSIDSTRDRGDPSSCMLIGPTGVGKSTLCKKLQDHFQSVDHPSTYAWGTATERPCIYVEVGASPTIKSLSTQIIEALHVKPKRALNTGSMEIMIVRRMHTLRLKLLILDEFHRLMDQGKDRTQLSTCRWLTSILNASGVPILLSGNEAIEPIVDRVPELSDRYPYRARLNYFPLGINQEAPDFLRVIASLEKKILELVHFDNYINLTDTNRYKAIYLATRGNFRRLAILLNDALLISILRGDQTLLWSDFASAASRLNFCCNPNPFLLSPLAVDHALATQKCTISAS